MPTIFVAAFYAWLILADRKDEFFSTVIKRG